jgi:hypothetical protein
VVVLLVLAALWFGYYLWLAPPPYVYEGRNKKPSAEEVRAELECMRGLDQLSRQDAWNVCEFGMRLIARPRSYRERNDGRIVISGSRGDSDKYPEITIEKTHGSWRVIEKRTVCVD